MWENISERFKILLRFFSSLINIQTVPVGQARARPTALSVNSSSDLTGKLQTKNSGHSFEPAGDSTQNHKCYDIKSGSKWDYIV